MSSIVREEKGIEAAFYWVYYAEVVHWKVISLHDYLQYSKKGMKWFIMLMVDCFQESFHEFCRVVSRLKSNYQLCELMKVEEYAGMMALLADFTIHSLRVGVWLCC